MNKVSPNKSIQNYLLKVDPKSENNKIDTSKYNYLTFIPQNLLE